MRKFAFLVHLGGQYRDELKHLASPLGWISESFYCRLMSNQPLSPFLWSDITLTAGSNEADGFVIMLPYTSRQLLDQRKAMLPRIRQALKLAADLGAEIVGLGGLTSAITLGGELVADNPYVSVTNGNAYTAVTIWQKTVGLIRQFAQPNPVVALVGATGGMGTLVSALLVRLSRGRYAESASYLLADRKSRRLADLLAYLNALNPYVPTATTLCMDDLKRADIVVALPDWPDGLPPMHQLKTGAMLLNTTSIGSNVGPLQQRPDVAVIDCGLTASPTLRFRNSGISLPVEISCACLSETMLLAGAGYEGDFSIGNPTLEQAEWICSQALVQKPTTLHTPASGESYKSPSDVHQCSEIASHQNTHLLPA